MRRHCADSPLTVRRTSVYVAQIAEVMCADTAASFIARTHLGGRSVMNAGELEREIFASSARGDVDRMFSLFDDSCVIHEAPTLPWGGEFVGKDGLRELVSKMTAHFDVSASVVEIFESSPTTAVALIAMDLRSKRTGQSLAVQVPEITRSRDGLIVEQTPFYWDTQLINEHV